MSVKIHLRVHMEDLLLQKWRKKTQKKMFKRNSLGDSMEKIPLIAIVGPTAVGKTALSIELAKKI